MAETSLVPHKNGSFDYKTINKNIRDVLENRSRLSNNVQIAMPFVRATTTIKIPSAFNMGDGNVGFSLGLHSIDTDMKYEDMYASEKNQMPLIGYTFTNNGTAPVYAIDPSSAIISGVFDRRAILYKNLNSDYTRIAPPGITNITIGRNKNGLLAYGQITISVPSLVQLESLHRTFLVPGVGMVLEWGQQFALESETTNTTGELSNIADVTFPWKDRNKREKLFNRLALNEVGIDEILQEYVYPSKGQYMWMFGRVANFNIKTNNDGSFECVVKIVGPSESAWAYSVTNTVVPAKDASSKFYCADKTNSVRTYLTNTTAGAFNFKTILDKYLEKRDGEEWKNHIWHAQHGSRKEGNVPIAVDKIITAVTDGAKQALGRPDLTDKPFQDADDAYFITWRFFVNVILNSEVDGFKKIFKDASLTDEERRTIGFLLPFGDGPTRDQAGVGIKKYIDDPMESYVGYNQFLRSVDLSTCFIVNEEAVRLAEQSQQYKTEDAKEFIKPLTRADQYILNAGEFGKSVNETQFKDKGLLSSGLWINHKAIIESFISADTVLHGVSNLLQRINQATLNYWNLTIDAAEPIALENGSMHSHNFMVIDANYKESLDPSVANFMNKVHIFNKYIRTDVNSNELVGSELLECTIDLSLPKRLFAQIATLGLVQPEDINKLNTLNGEPISETEGLASSPKLSDPNDTLREMFSILVLDPKDDTAQGPDLTILPKSQRKKLIEENKTCGAQNAQVTGQTGGQGNQAAAANTKIQGFNNADRLKTELDNIKSGLKPFEAQCKECQSCQDKQTQFDIDAPLYNPPKSTVGDTAHPGIGADSTKYQNGKLPDIALDSIGGGYLLQKEAAAQFKKLSEAYQKEMGIPLQVSSAYRSYEQQVNVKVQYGKGAATPGFSSHGWGAAVDIPAIENKSQAVSQKLSLNRENARVGSAVRGSDYLYNWLALNGPKFGWFNPARLSGGAEANEPWHWEYWGFKTGTQASPTIEKPTRLTNSTSTAIQTEQTDLNNCYKKVGEMPIKLSTFDKFFGPDENSTSKAQDAAGGNLQANIGRNKFLNSIKNETDVTKKGMAICDQCAKANQVIAQGSQRIDVLTKASNATNTAKREYPYLGNLWRYLEIFKDYMVASITSTADGVLSNAFGASPGSLSIAGDLVLPGINGLRVGELFWIDRIPAFYKVFGAFQILSIEDTISINGWSTKIHTRFNFLGRNWQTAIAKQLNGER